MSKSFIPSRSLLSSFSRSLKYDKPTQQCLRLRSINASCLHARAPAPKSFSTSSARTYKTVEEQRSRYKSGPFSYRAASSSSPPARLIFYFRYEKARMERLRIAEATKGVGRPKVGGPFELVDQEGRRFTDEDMRGRYALVYFGFSHCPDICPEELDKMAVMIDLVNGEGEGEGKKGEKKGLLPLFITCDPARDTPAVLKEYLKEFHAGIVGLTGSWDQVKDVCKKYRVYFSTPQGVKKGEDYLVDHSIYFYLMDPEGDFVEAIGRQHSPEQAAKIIGGHVGDWRGK
ncbi:Mitochondrial protein SCO1 [Lachnellula arida]|uniref:Mitochondrial protein SCO1 n=1 Tax=Lachnellula arida TaxID=1316785 RepID=A0A8T9B5M4_9HELO|nr:Mitochondrial protein SCO1 [Lachnellula arida]